MAVGMNIKCKKREKLKQYTLLYNIQTFGKNIRGEKGKGTEISRKNIKIKKMGWRRISSCREFYTTEDKF